MLDRNPSSQDNPQLFGSNSIDHLVESQIGTSMEEDPLQFWMSFQHRKNAIDPTCSIEIVRQQISQLQTYLNENVHYLPQYDIRRAGEDIRDLTRRADEHRRNEQAQKKEQRTGGRRKRFAFSKPTTLSRDAAATSADVDGKEGNDGNDGHLVTTLLNSGEMVHEEKGGNSDGNCDDDSSGNGLVVRDLHGSDKHFQIAPINSNDNIAEDEEEQDLVIEHCSDGAIVEICRVVGTCYIRHLRNCVIRLAPVRRSVFIDNCEGCTLSLAAQQIRIHRSRDCTLHLYVRSQPIIEHSTDIRVAPYNFEFKGIKDVMVRALGQGGRNRYAEVQDFQWLRRDKSPNFEVLEEDRDNADLQEKHVFQIYTGKGVSG